MFKEKVNAKTDGRTTDNGPWHKLAGLRLVELKKIQTTSASTDGASFWKVVNPIPMAFLFSICQIESRFWDYAGTMFLKAFLRMFRIMNDWLIFVFNPFPNNKF